MDPICLREGTGFSELGDLGGLDVLDVDHPRVEDRARCREAEIERSVAGQKTRTGLSCALAEMRPRSAMMIIASSAPQNRRALEAITSMIGCRSSGDRDITPRISLTAVCRSSDSLVSLKRRTFSIAITAWSAKALDDLIWRVRVEEPDRLAEQDRADHVGGMESSAYGQRPGKRNGRRSLRGAGERDARSRACV